jgi:hypothetical protein
MQMWKRYLTATADMNVQQCLRQPMKLYIFTSDLWTRGVQESNFLLVDELCAARRWGSGHLCLKADLHGTHRWPAIKLQITGRNSPAQHMEMHSGDSTVACVKPR